MPFIENEKRQLDAQVAVIQTALYYHLKMNHCVSPFPIFRTISEKENEKEEKKPNLVHINNAIEQHDDGSKA